MSAFAPRSLIRTLILGVGAWLLLLPAVALAQEPVVDVRRAQATRPELQAAMSELEQVIASPGYSKSYRKNREAEVEMVRTRLSEGDFQVGDQIDIAVVGEGSLSGKFTVLQGRVLSLPQITPISLQGVLRSEVRDHLTTQIGKYVKNPQVTVQGSYIRLAIFGAVGGGGGYYTIASDALVSEAIMQAGGPRGSVDMEKSKVRRQGRDVMEGTEIQRAIEQGLSLDQLNLHGGDELVIGGQSSTALASAGNRQGGFRNWFWPIQAAVSLSYLLIRIF